MVGVSREAATARRRAILAAAVAELAEHGPHALAVTSVAARAGTVPTAVYRRFPSTDALLAAAVDEHLAPATGPWRAARASAVDPTDAPPSPNRRTAPDVTDAWAQLLVGGAWPGPARAPANHLLEGDGTTAAGPPGPAHLAAALDLGVWLAARGRGTTPRWDRRHGALLAGAFETGPTDLPPAAEEPAERATDARPYPPVDELGRQLLGAAAAVVAEQGAAAPIGSITRRAGSSTGALYNRFSGKAGLLAEALVARAPDVHDAVTTLAPPHDDELFALRVAALVAAPTDPEVAAAVAAVEPPAARALRRRVHPDRCAGLAPTTAANALAALPLGQWVVGRVRGMPPSTWSGPNARLAVGVGLGAGPSR